MLIPEGTGHAAATGINFVHADPGMIEQLLDLVQSVDMTMLLVTHDESLVNRSQRKLVLQGGTLHEAVD